VRLIIGLSLGLTLTATWTASAESIDKRRNAVKLYAENSLRAKPSNHCGAFADIAAFAASRAPDAGAWLEDMRLVVVGEDWQRRAGKRGKYYMGSISKDTGFKSELRDGSPQVEHAMAAIYLGKLAPPGASELSGFFVEFVTAGLPERKVDAADYKLWAYGADIGARVANANLKDVATAIRRTLCE
jgi:hypothetical protein